MLSSFVNRVQEVINIIMLSAHMIKKKKSAQSSVAFLLFLLFISAQLKVSLKRIRFELFILLLENIILFLTIKFGIL